MNILYSYRVFHRSAVNNFYVDIFKQNIHKMIIFDLETLNAQAISQV